MRIPVAILFALLVPLAAPAQDGTDSPEQDETERPTPDVTIIQGRDKTIAEYRIQGRLYMIKVTPRKGPPYYLVDTDGDGNLETHRSELTEDLLIPSWTLLEWK
jgi:hypothetical protein